MNESNMNTLGATTNTYNQNTKKAIYKWREQNPDKWKEQQRKDRRIYYQKHKEKCKEQSRIAYEKKKAQFDELVKYREIYGKHTTITNIQAGITT